MAALWWVKVLAGFAAFLTTGISASLKIEDFFDRFLPEPPPNVPRIPPPVDDFVGRTDILDGLTRDIKRRRTHIIGLRGMGGVGKTESAKKLAQRLTRRYRDGGIMVNLQGVEKEPIEPETALAALTRLLLGADTKLPEDLAGLKIEYEKALRGKKMIVLLDNADDTAQVEDLIAPEPCLTLITTRNVVALPGLKMEMLGALAMRQAVSMLRGISPRIGNHAKDIASEVGRLPLGLRLAGTALAEDATLDPAQHLAALRAQGGTVDYAQRALGASVDLLDDALRNRWCQLAVFPADFDIGGAASVWGAQVTIPQLDSLHENVPDELQELIVLRAMVKCRPVEGNESALCALSELVRRSLVTFHVTDRRYVLHDLARAYAAHLACFEDADALETSRSRHAWHYRRVLEATNSQCCQMGDEYLAGHASFLRERHNIEAAQRWSSQHASDGGQAAWLCDDFSYSGDVVLLPRQTADDRVAWIESGFAAAVALGLRSRQALHLNNLGKEHDKLGRPSKAIECHSRALDISRETRNGGEEHVALRSLGRLYAHTGQFGEAIRCLESRIGLDRNTGDRQDEGSALSELGMACRELGTLEESRLRYLQAIDIAVECNNHLDEADRRYNLGLVLSEADQWEAAHEQWAMAFGQWQAIGLESVASIARKTLPSQGH